jgi:hypothetical protein
VDWKAKVDLFEQRRREHEFGIGTIAGVAAKFGVHRRMVRRALAGALPPPHHYPPRAKPKLGMVADFIDKVLEEDCRAPRKQRHTARRLYRKRCGFGTLPFAFRSKPHDDFRQMTEWAPICELQSGVYGDVGWNGFGAQAT